MISVSTSQTLSTSVTEKCSFFSGEFSVNITDISQFRSSDKGLIFRRFSFLQFMEKFPIISVNVLLGHNINATYNNMTKRFSPFTGVDILQQIMRTPLTATIHPNMYPTITVT